MLPSGWPEPSVVLSTWSMVSTDFRANELLLGTGSLKTEQRKWKETQAVHSKAMDRRHGNLPPVCSPTPSWHLQEPGQLRVWLVKERDPLALAPLGLSRAVYFERPPEETLKKEQILGNSRKGGREGNQQIGVTEQMRAVGSPMAGRWGRQGIMWTELSYPRDKHLGHLPTYSHLPIL